MKLLVNAPSGLQELLEIGSGGEYFDPARVLWDERVDGALPAVTLGGMTRVNNGLVLDATLLAASVAAAANAPIPVPPSVTMRQARLALMSAGLLTNVNTAIANMTGTPGDAARIEWEFSGVVERNQPLVLGLGPTLGLTSAQLDALFVAAAKL